ncbi:signal recognition particle subunit SRP68 [Cryptococcus neoformans Tu259-1]|uniref:Signal recognition particle subunit SRP68 n=1 Tax=Cryptococcus neoformans Tu259-1 TaxID=1230072 RepID=A0A854QF33_CRYNE|nr:signal recognition particle subunit SRP68 [Cryptococcus neoformans var. grubii AD1-83a]OWZ54848.1 signal recognition particle subunit SRP68 [Cryptococcus neoformans var. grubii 125.91]OXG23051.1 signal recognition particle subunit SRP68 [Cryptococcus neoformans var. grubii Tu259-1]OXG62202.1 signal recognition particle subunit SRP68 [Cryptococcus neoformans var. grubii MW-RSA1955]OXG65638.1 signal recognition particle subunit SRP68 [Cryptococcus neoformans var. grubii c8]OXG67339.1 signal r
MSVDQVDVSFKVLSLLSKERAVYGLRNGDHERYRRHCSNKVHRLRQVTGTTCGKKTYKAPSKIEAESVKDVRQLQLLLFSTERALAHSHELKRDKTHSKKDQLSWLRQAFKLSTQLYSLVQSLSAPSSDLPGRADAKTLGEITIYHLTIRSELSFEKSNWIGSLTDLACRRKLLATLVEGAKDSYDEALANEFIDSHDPLIRYCAYKLGRAESHDIEGVMADIEPEVLEEALPGMSQLLESLRTETGVEEMEEGRRKLEDVEFAGEKVELRNAEIVGVMVRVQDALSKLGDGKSKGARGMKRWDRVLSVLGEAEGVARKLLEDNEASGASSSLRSTRTAQSLALAHQYIIYLLLTHRIRRDLALVETLSSSPVPKDPTQFKVQGGKAKLEEVVKTLGAIVKLYGTMLQSLKQAAELSVVQEKEGVRSGVEGLEAYFHAIRCYNLARLHCIHPDPSYPSAVQLLSNASLSLRQAQDFLSSPIDEPIVSVPAKDLSSLSKDISALEKASKRGLFGQSVEKPVFFDMAFNYIDLPIDELQRMASNGEKVEATNIKTHEKEVEIKSVENVKKSRESRETTPAVDSQEEKQEGKKGWLGGWFGRK